MSVRINIYPHMLLPGTLKYIHNRQALKSGSKAEMEGRLVMMPQLAYPPSLFSSKNASLLS
jgi:hypothetical protein